MAKVVWISTSSGDWNSTGNWSTGSVPVSTDDVVFANNAVAVTTNLNQSSVALNSLTIDQSYTGQIGTASAYLQIQASTVLIGQPSGAQTNSAGSGRIKLDLGSATASTIVVYNTATNSTDTTLEPVRIVGTNAGNTLSVLGGRVGVATTIAGEVATFSAINVANSSGAVVNIASGVTLTTLNASAGTVNLYCACTTINSSSGSTINTYGTGAITTINAGGICNLSSTGTITTLNVPGTADFSKDPRSRTVTNCNLYKGGTLNTNNGSPLSITLTNGVKLVQCNGGDVTYSYPNNLTLKLS